MNFCKPSSEPKPTPAASSSRGESVDLGEFSYQHAGGGSGYNSHYYDYDYSGHGTPHTPKPIISEDYGLSSEFYTDDTTGGLARPDISISNSGRVIGGEGATAHAAGGIDGAHLPRMRGDAKLRPNTGNSNQNDGALLGKSLLEITAFLRLTTIVSTVAAIVWEGFAFPMRLIGMALVHPAQFVLGAYLGVFCLLVLGAELNIEALKDNFGFLYDPLSRGFVLLMMSGMSLGILSTWWESLLGLAFLVVGTGYIYTYLQYPEYRTWKSYNERAPTAWQEGKMYWTGGDAAVQTAAWATPSKASVAVAAAVVGSETKSLLGNA